MDSSQWHHQEIGLVKPMENSNSLIASSSTNNNNNTSNLSISAIRPQQVMVERRGARPQKEQALNCPRCKSTNTKFCYYNNYSLTQPRYFCKACRRYWTEGGTLRNVPIGGSSRKNKKNPSSSNPSSSSRAPIITTSKAQNSNQDLNLASNITATNISSPAISAMDLLKSAGGMMINPFMPIHPMPVVQDYPLGFGLNDFGGNAMNFTLDGSSGNVEEGPSGGRMLFPFGETRQESSSNANNVNNSSDHGDNQFEQKGFWNGMMGGGGSW